MDYIDIDDCQIRKNDDGSFSVNLNSEVADVDDTTLEYAVQLCLENVISRHDCAMWHTGKLSRHLRGVFKMLKPLGFDPLSIQIWGMPDQRADEAPLDINISAWSKVINSL